MTDVQRVAGDQGAHGAQGAQGSQQSGQQAAAQDAGAQGAQAGQQQNGGQATIVGSQRDAGQQGQQGQQQAGQQQSKGAFPDDWREQLAGGDDKKLKQMQRYADPMAWSNKTFALEQKVSSGEYKAQLPADATDEQVAAFRKEAGLPEKADGYVAALALPNGHVPGEADKPIIAEFAEKVAHKGMMTPKQFNEVVGWYYGVQDAIQLKQEEGDSHFKKESEDALRAKWGGNYRANVNAADTFIARFGSVAESFLGARIAAPTEKDPGRTVKVGDHPEILAALAQFEMELNPGATLVPPGGADPMKTLEGELAAIRKRASDDPDGYDKDKALQVRRREITEALQKMKPRAA